MSDSVQVLFRHVERCRQCYGDRCTIRVAVPDPLPSRVRVLLVGEQPARGDGGNGAKAADHTVAYLAEYLAHAGVDPAEVLYVTAVLCSPDDGSLRTGRPTAVEVRNCSTHLGALIERVRPRLIVTLGHTGLLSVQFAFREWTELRQFILNYDVGAMLTRGDLAVYPLYLPSESTRRTRSEGRQIRDWQKIPALLASLERLARVR